jgi:hypothetical protein
MSSCDDQIQGFFDTVEEKYDASDLTNKLNNLIEYVTENSNCDSECQREREIERLRRIWVESEEELITLPTTVNENEKNYYDALYGENYYKDVILRRRHEREARGWRRREDNSFYNNNNIIGIELRNYTTETNSLSKLKLFFNELKKKNKQIKDNIDSYYSKKTTAARKVWYQDQDIEKMEYIEYILKIFYYGIFIAYIIFSGFIKNAEYKNKKIVLLLIVYLVIPFILDNIITFILELINNYYNKAPS